MLKRFVFIMLFGPSWAHAFGSDASEASYFSIMTLDLHGYHPMGESERFYEDLNGHLEPAPSHNFYFTPEELGRGHRRRLDSLAEDIREIQPHAVIFQEVGAGAPSNSTPPSCLDFSARPEDDLDSANSAWRLYLRLRDLGYEVGSACLGHTGWITSADQFSTRRIVKKTASGIEVVHDFATIPYPHGVLVEGYGILVKPPWRILRSNLLRIRHNQLNDTTSVQVTILGSTMTPYRHEWISVVNVHSGHKVEHFEQAVAIRRAIDRYLATLPNQEGFSGLVVAGNFNAQLYRPQSHTASEVGSAVWELAVNREFDFTLRSHNHHTVKEALTYELTKLNRDQTYKPWATIQDEYEAQTRINLAIDSFLHWQHHRDHGQGFPLTLSEALDTSTRNELCHPYGFDHASCEFPHRFDHIFFSAPMAVENSFLMYRHNNHHQTEGTYSDHPAVYAEFSRGR